MTPPKSHWDMGRLSGYPPCCRVAFYFRSRILMRFFPKFMEARHRANHDRHLKQPWRHIACWLHLGLWKVGLYKPTYTTCPTCKWQQLGPGPCRVIPLHDTWMREVNENRERFRAELKAKAEARRRARCAVSR